MSQFVQITHTHQYVVPFHTKKLFTTLRVNSLSFSVRIVPLFDTMLIHQGEGSGTPSEPHHTPFPKAETSHPTTSSIPPPSIPTIPIPPVTQPITTPIIQYSRRARITQSSALLTVADKPASPVRDVSEGEACATESGFIADQDRATIVKSFTLPHDSAPRVTSPAADEGKEEIVKLNDRVKVLEDREGVADKQSGDDALIKGRSINEGEAAAERISNDSEEIARVLTSIDAATVLAGRIDVPTGSGFIPTAGPPATVISTSSEGKGSGTPSEPHHTPFPKVETSHPTTLSILLPYMPTTPIPLVTQPVTTPIIQYSRRARIAQSSALPTIADEPASPVRDVSKWEACHTESGFIADQDRATIVKSSTLPHDSAPRVTSPAADEG
nr:hypothetical protein [Tanacetum cinerariifolium]